MRQKSKPPPNLADRIYYNILAPAFKWISVILGSGLLLILFLFLLSGVLSVIGYVFTRCHENFNWSRWDCCSSRHPAREYLLDEDTREGGEEVEMQQQGFGL